MTSTKETRPQQADVLGDRYRLHAEVGEGRFATVWRARDQKMQVPVAVKVLRQEFAADAEQRARFAREARLMGRFSSPHILRATDMDVDGPHPYFVMDLLEGISLRAFLDGLRQDPASVATACALVDQLLAALDEVHAAQVVHHDVKPENVLLAETEDDTYHVWLLDFGIACDLKNTEPTPGRAQMGTPSAMAPEALLDDEYTPHPGVDVFGVGLIAHELLSGAQFWAGKTPETIADSYAHGVTPTAVSETKYGKKIGVSQAVAKVVDQALALAPERRHPNAGALREDLRASLRLDPDNLEVGSLFDDRYEIIAKAGRGGMGAVYQARDSERGMVVALKLLALPKYVPEEDLQGVRRRFVRETEVLIALQHPHIGRILGKGTVDGTPYYSLEFIKGVHFADAAAELGWTGVVRVVGQVAAALQHAAEHGVIHRDIKSANILIMETGDAKLVDFGVVRVAGSALTEANFAIGTRGFRAPEQIRNAREATPASDQWGLAATVYELLAGEPPAGDSTRVRGADTLIRQIAPLQGKPDIPPQIAAVIDRALAAEPRDRYPTATDFAAALSETTDETPALWVTPPGHAASTRPLQVKTTAKVTPFAAATDGGTDPGTTSAQKRVWMFWVAAAGAAVAVALTVGMSMRGSSDSPPRQRPSVATMPAPAATADAAARVLVVAPRATDAGLVDASEVRQELKLRIETWEGNKQRRGVAFMVNGTRYVSPATVGVSPNAKVAVRVQSRSYAGRGTWLITKDVTKKLVVRRRQRRATPTRDKPAPIEPIDVESHRKTPR